MPEVQDAVRAGSLPARLHDAEEVVAYNGVIPVGMSGKRKPTSYRCAACSAAQGRTVWHDTARGLHPEPCPLESQGVARPVGHPEVRAKSPAPALIPREKLGSTPRRKWVTAQMPGPGGGQ
jgi:hypothetical protein